MPEAAAKTRSIRYGDEKRIRVGVSLIGDYRCQVRPALSKMLIHGYFEDERQEKAFESHLLQTIRAYGRNWCWIENCSVWDARKEDQLPDVVYVVVTASQEYDGQFAPTSWFGTEAYASKDEAERAAEKQSEITWHWVLPATRFKPTS